VDILYCSPKDIFSADQCHSVPASISHPLHFSAPALVRLGGSEPSLARSIQINRICFVILSLRPEIDTYINRPCCPEFFSLSSSSCVSKKKKKKNKYTNISIISAYLSSQSQWLLQAKLTVFLFFFLFFRQFPLDRSSLAFAPIEHFLSIIIIRIDSGNSPFRFARLYRDSSRGRMSILNYK
jgi:hypothetical protein